MAKDGGGAADPPGEARSDLWFTFHLGRRLKDLYRASRAGVDLSDPASIDRVDRRYARQQARAFASR